MAINKNTITILKNILDLLLSSDIKYLQDYRNGLFQVQESASYD